MTTFNELGLSNQALQAVELLGYHTPTEVQMRAIPQILERRDLIASAKTGTGKTAAFSLPLLDTLGHAKGSQGPLMLVITPTRELAGQIGQVCKTIATLSHHRVSTVVGGLSYEPQIKELKRGVDVLIATPGRLIDLMEQKAVHLGEVETLVLDEADRMLDMGFLPSVRKIVAATPSQRQTLLFSATIDSSIKGSMAKLLRNPSLIEVAHKGETADTVEQYIVRTPQTLKPALLKAVLAEKGHNRVIVFTRTRSRADATCRRLKRMGYSVEAIHSNRSQNQRRRALQNFAEGITEVIIATDVLARGIDVEGVDHVINYDLPTVAEDYVHRIGRTGRAGEQGWALSFVSPETEEALRDIQKLIHREIPLMAIESFDQAEAMLLAAEHATQKSARRDPDIAQAAKEMKRRQHRKQKTRELRGDDPSTCAARSTSASHDKKTKGSHVTPSRPRHLQKKGSNTKTSAGRTSTATLSPNKRSPHRSTSGNDLRPGRAQRAAIAQRRSKGGSR